MAPARRYTLKLERLDFISPVDVPAQETAKVLLIKRAGGVEGFARVAKVDEGLGLVFCWAFTSTTEDGAAYFDLQGDQIDEASFVKAAADFMSGQRATDEMHDGKASGYVAFAMPMTPEIAKAFGVTTKTTGLMVALKPPPDVLAKFKSGEYTGVSIAGAGVREPVTKAKVQCAACGADGTADAMKCSKCGAAMKAARLKAARNAAARAARKDATLVVLTSEIDGHAHSINLEDPAESWSDQLTTSYQTEASASNGGHCHAWIYDATTGAVTIAADSGHTHTVAAVVPPEVLARAAADDDCCCRACGSECDVGASYCASCGASMSGAPATVEDKPSGPTVVVVSSRAPAGDSPRPQPAATVKSNSQENQNMDPKFAKMLSIALLLPEAQRAHVAKLAPEDQQHFLGLDSAGREATVSNALLADPVVYTTKAGTHIRKSHGELAEKQARQIDTQAAQLAAAETELQISKAKSDHQEIEKRATELIPLIGKNLEERSAIMKFAAGIPDETFRNGVIEALKGANAAIALLAKANGYTAGLESMEPRQAWDAGLAAFAKSKNIDNPLDAIVPFLATDTGKNLKKSLDAGRPSAQAS